jgi:hypothetical protein
MITFQNELNNINPAYNDSIINFSSSITGATYCDININDLPTFKIYPIAGNFTFNFKEIVKVLINQNNFEDGIYPSIIDQYVYDDASLSLKISPTFSIHSAITADTITKDYTFLKNVEQLISYKQKLEFENDIKVLLPTNNFTDYFIPYFEGYPVDFGIYGITSGDTYQLKNVTTISETGILSGGTSNIKRIYLSDGAMANDDILGLSTTTNLVELWVNGVFNSNINVKKTESKCGVYLKWFNNSGAYSYWLFDEVFDTNYNFKTLDEINGNYDNLSNLTSTNNITGKLGTSSYKLKTTFKSEEKEYITSILSSPKVEMYIYQTPYNQTGLGKFIGVKVSDGSFTFSNKISNNKLQLTITLPDFYTITL